MIDRVKQQPPPLQSRIVTVLDNPNASASELSELVAETELAIVTADETIASERASAADLTSTPSAEAAQQAISRAEAAGLNRDRLQSALPRLRDKLATSLECERHDRWLSTYQQAKTERDALAEEFASTYPTIVAQLVDLFNRVQQCDQKCAEVDSTASAMQNEHRRLTKTELTARGLEAFSQDRPEIAKTVQLPDFDISSRKLWPPLTLSLAEHYAALSMAPYHPGAAWCEPEYQARRRADQAKQNRELSEHYARMTAEQEDRINREEKEHFAASRK
jgi:hypothetical protein